MSSSKRFWGIAGAGAVALLIFRAVFVSPTAAKADGVRTEIGNLRAEREGYFPRGGVPIEDAEKHLAAEKAALGSIRAAVGRVALDVPEELREGDGRDLSYYQVRREELLRRAKDTGIAFVGAASGLGLPLEVAEDKVPEYLVRIAVAGRLVEAVAAAGVSALSGAKAVPARPVLSAVQGARAGPSSEITELPVEVTVSADERSLIRLVQEVSRPERFLALKALVVEVKDPTSGVFEARLEVAGVLVSERPRRPEVAKEEAPAEPGEDSDATVPVSRVRRRF